MTVDLVLGTRPEIIKLAPVAEALRRRKIGFRIIHTGQHYSHEMDRVFFDELHVPRPSAFLEVGSGPHGAQTGLMLQRLEREFRESTPALVLVQGDTNTVLAGSLAAAKMDIPVGHVEAGLRCFDMGLVEEQNRVLTDHLSTLHFAPTRTSGFNLRREGIRGRHVSVTGNTIVDAVQSWLPRAASIGVRSPAEGAHDHAVATLHRQENVDHRARLESMLCALQRVGEKLKVQVILPLHPRTAARMKQWRLKGGSRVDVRSPVGYLSFLGLLGSAQIVLTDSGGVQEEACILRVPCVTMRDSTERPESVHVGANIVAGTSPEAIVRAAVKMARRPRRWRNPFGDGKAGERIGDACSRFLSRRSGP
ncbi:MAG TPA: UDP-N-acetylglucosamine 2-epimerase (non-hydrolyzing) [Thermoplasmata archaeon]|nr:UDP-N-acetylglucosamine 2-epimerase (non-hydrolyzing) [Thermoplasmata archaeon]